MAMSTGAKIAIGCGVALVAAGIAVSVLVVGGAYWAKGKIEETAGEFKAEVERIDALQKKVDAYPYTPPSDGVIEEQRLLKFLNVRKSVYPIYETEFPEFQKIKGEPEGLEAVRVLGKTALVLKKLRVALLEGLAREEMSETEYRFLAGAVYKTVASAAVEKSTGQSISEAASSSAEAAAREAEQAAEQANLPEDAKQALRESARRMREQAQQAREQTQGIDAPAANVALFYKYKQDIAKYAMTGLEGIGF
jgi:hypothetical protein